MEEKTKKPEQVLIYEAMTAVMAAMGPIAKSRENIGQHYKFRGIDDVYNLVQPIFAKHGIFMTCEVLSESASERESKSGGILLYRILKLRYRFIAKDGSYVQTEVVGEGMDSGDKSANKAMSVGQKYAILQAFLVPTDEPKDPEEDNPEPAPKPKTTLPKASPSQFSNLDEFSKAKKMLGDAEYYAILKKLNIEHANQIAVDDRVDVLTVMRDRYKEIKAASKS